tara:strand:- start:144 stop:560 length:417 start_codon:yes stop_codon:yes gene_type:complete
MITQKIIDLNKKQSIQWNDIFSERQFEYLAHVINGLIKKGELDDISIEYGEKGNNKVLHIYEPFCTLNYLGYMCPSVVSISFSTDNDVQVEFYTGGDNGIDIFSNELSLDSTSKLPKNSTEEIDFWHFVDSIGTCYVE